MIKLFNVIDTRTGKHHSVVICSEKKARFFIPANAEQ
jgi:hypothetical protein